MLLPAPTLLYKALWGIDPPSAKRRLRSHFWFWLPLILLLVIGGVTANILSSGRLAAEEALVSLCLSTMILALGMHGIRLCVTDDVKKFRTNWADLALAGVTPRDYLWSYARLRVSSGIVISIVVAICFVGLCLVDPKMLGDGEFFIFVPPLFIDPLMLLTGGILLDVASWTRPGWFVNRAARQALMIVMGPFSIYLATIFIYQLLKVRTTNDELVCLVIGTLFGLAIALRIWFIRREWKQAIARLSDDLSCPFS